LKDGGGGGGDDDDDETLITCSITIIFTIGYQTYKLTVMGVLSLML
jgi:hypothetical protein